MWELQGVLPGSKEPKGFTLIELVISLAILATLAAIGTGSFIGAQRRVMLDSTAQEIAVYLRFAQQKSISQEQAQQWGVHFENPTSGNPFYALFMGATYSGTNALTTLFLPLQLKFLIPSRGSSFDVSFLKLTGVPATTQSVVITFASEPSSTTQTRTISVNALGVVTLQ